MRRPLGTERGRLERGRSEGDGWRKGNDYLSVEPWLTWVDDGDGVVASMLAPGDKPAGEDDATGAWMPGTRENMNWLVNTELTLSRKNPRGLSCDTE